MAIGKSKKIVKKKGNKKKIVDPFTKKEWYKIRAPALFSERFCGWTPATKSSGTYSSTDSLKNRVIEVCLADLNKDEDQAFRKMKLISEEVQGSNLLCNFYGMDFTRDKLCSLIKKWQTLIEAWADVKTTDGYTVRMFAIGFTKKRQNQVSKTSYAQSGQIRAIRKKMVDIMTAEASKSDLKDLVAKFIPESIGKEIEKACHGVYPLQNVYIRKAKLLKAPKFDLTRLMELHEGNDDTGRKVEEGAVETLEGAGGRL